MEQVTAIGVVTGAAGALDALKDASQGDAQASGIAAAAPYLYNGATFDRQREAPGADANAATGYGAGLGLVYNGAALDRAYSASAANLAAQSGKGAALVSGPGQWQVNSAAAANTQAIATKAAGAAGVRHVAVGLTAVLAAGSTAPTVPATPVQAQILDGATVIWTGYLAIPATAGACATLVVSDLCLPGTAATAMSAQFSAAGGAGTFESVTLVGFDVS